MDFNSAALGSISATPDVTAVNQRLGEGGPRAIQFGLKLIFYVAQLRLILGGISVEHWKNDRMFADFPNSAIAKPQSWVEQKNQGEHGEHGDERGNGFMEGRFGVSSDHVHPRVPRAPLGCALF